MVSLKDFVLHGKLSSIEFCFFLAGSVALFDSYIMQWYSGSIFSVNPGWYMDNLGVSGFIVFLLVGSIFYAMVIPGIIYAFDNFTDFKSNKPDGWVSLGELQRNATLEGDSVFYQYAEYLRGKFEKTQLIRRYVFAFLITFMWREIVTLLIFEDSVSVVGFFSELASNNFIWRVAVAVFVLGLLLYILYVFLEKSNIEYDFHNIPKYEERMYPRWINEINTGLVDLSVVFRNFNAYKNLRYDLGYSNYKKESCVAFCVEFGLLAFREGSDTPYLTAKGNFYNQYISMHGVPNDE